MLSKICSQVYSISDYKTVGGNKNNVKLDQAEMNHALYHFQICVDLGDLPSVLLL